MVRHCSLQKAVDDSTNEGEACSNDVHNFYHCMFLWNKFCSLGMRWQWYQQKPATLHLQCICPSFYMFKKNYSIPSKHLKSFKGLKRMSTWKLATMEQPKADKKPSPALILFVRLSQVSSSPANAFTALYRTYMVQNAGKRTWYALLEVWKCLMSPRSCTKT